MVRIAGIVHVASTAGHVSVAWLSGTHTWIVQSTQHNERCASGQIMQSQRICEEREISRGRSPEGDLYRETSLVSSMSNAFHACRNRLCTVDQTGHAARPE